MSGHSDQMSKISGQFQDICDISGISGQLRALRPTAKMVRVLSQFWKWGRKLFHPSAEVSIFIPLFQSFCGGYITEYPPCNDLL